MVALFVVAPIGIGGLMLLSHFLEKRKALQGQQKALHNQQEKQVIRLAQQKGGRLTIPEIAVETSMTTAEAEEFMQEMASKGYVNMEVTDTGVIVYEFYEIAHRGRLES